MHHINPNKSFGLSNLQRFSSPPRSQSATVCAPKADSVELGCAARQPEKSWRLGKALKFAALTCLAVTSATAATAAPCNQETTYQEAVVDTFEQKMDRIPEDLRTPDLMQMAASRHRINQMSIQRSDINGQANVSFSLNGGPEHSIQCEGDSTEIPGLENADQGQSGLMSGHQQIISNYLTNQ